MEFNDKMKKHLQFILVLCFLASYSEVFKNAQTFENSTRISKLGTPIRIEFYKARPNVAFQHSDTASFIIQKREDLTEAIAEIQNADSAGPWKGAGWNQIRIYFPDTIVKITTNTKIIGLFASGNFYKLKENNFIIKNLGMK